MKRGDVVPAPLEAAARLIVAHLTPDLQVLLRSDDPDVLVDRLVRLDVAAANPGDSEELDTAVGHVVVGRRTSVWEWGARLAIVLAALATVVAAGLAAASYVGQAFPRLIPISWLTWPPAPRIFTSILLLVVGAVALGYLAVWLRSVDRVRTARLACRLAAVHELDSWPGILLDGPFPALGQRWSYPGWAFVVAALVLAAASLFLGVGSVLGWTVVVVWILLGAALLWRSWPYRRAHDLAERTLFIGRPA